jgi:chemotaxis protein CheD
MRGVAQVLGPTGFHATRFLHPGEWVVSAEPLAVTTILASCVAICLWDPVRGTGGVNHFLLAHGGPERLDAGRYGDTALALLLEGLSVLGSAPTDLSAKVFGGAWRLGATLADIGTVNVAFALAVLEAARIPILACDVGGTRPRKVLFHTDDGDAWVRGL